MPEPVSSSSPAVNGQKAPSAKRCIKTFKRRVFVMAGLGQKAPSAKRCIKTCDLLGAVAEDVALGQKAPSAKRCIKTWVARL